MKKFNKKFTNKLVSYTDRYFTYDYKSMKREGTTKLFDFHGINFDTNTAVTVDRNSVGLWVSIRQNDKHIHSGFLKSYADVANFKKMIRCLG